MSIIAQTKVSVVVLLSTIVFYLPLDSRTSHSTGNSRGRIEGRVFDGKTGDPLPSATVAVLGTYLGSYTDDSGYFCVSKIPPGIYNLRVTFIGYATAQKDSILVTDTTTIHVDFPLSSWCNSWGDSAKADLKKGIVRILLSGLIVGYYETPQGKNLTHKYGFEYSSSCTLYPDCADSYNEVIEEYLEKRNGKGWNDQFQKQFKKLDTSDH